VCACHSFRLEHFASRHPVKATLRLAPLGLDRGPSRCRDRFPERKEWQGLTLAEADLNFPLDTGQPSHGGRTKQHGADHRGLVPCSHWQSKSFQEYPLRQRRFGGGVQTKSVDAEAVAPLYLPEIVTDSVVRDPDVATVNVVQ
jgi:hypothetical protein